ncbi:MAG TPA: hypothetical protein PKC28_10955 [Bdellovibrionales bacterium]|nr:hypothetical protein [Bdellovibrionales bacterium]
MTNLIKATALALLMLTLQGCAESVVLPEESTESNSQASNSTPESFVQDPGSNLPVVSTPKLTAAAYSVVSGSVVQLAVTGGTAPYSFSVSPASAGSVNSSSLRFTSAGAAAVATIRVTDGVGNANEIAINILADTSETGTGTGTGTGTADKYTVFINHMYNVALGRAPDAGGFQNAYTMITSSPTVATCQALMRLYYGAEFDSYKFSDADMIIRLYLGVLNRYPSSTDLDTWLKSARNNSRAVIKEAFITSPEGVNRCNTLLTAP